MRQRRKGAAVDYTEIRYDVADGVATITLNRPEKMNAFSTRMIAEWTDALETARDDDGVRAVIVTGAGRGFCSGMDVAAEAGGQGVLQTESGPAAARNSLRYNVHRVARALALLDKPYIAAINGPAVGAGMDMASTADIRFASETARVGMAYVRMGIVPGDGGAYFLGPHPRARKGAGADLDGRRDRRAGSVAYRLLQQSVSRRIPYG